MFCCPSVYSASSYQVLSLLSMSLHLSIDVLLHPHQLSRGVTYSMSLMKWKYSYFNFFIFQLLTSLSHFYFLSSALTLSLYIYMYIYISSTPTLFPAIILTLLLVLSYLIPSPMLSWNVLCGSRSAGWRSVRLVIVQPNSSWTPLKKY